MFVGNVRYAPPDDGGGGGADDGLEVLFVQDGEPIEEPAPEADPAPTGKVLTQEEYDALLRKADNANALADPISELVRKVGAAPAQPVQPQQPGESDEEFYARMEQEAFLPGRFGEVMKKVADRQNAPVINQMAQIIIDQSRQILRGDPDVGATFRKYEGEIMEVAKQMRPSPTMYREAYEKVILRHQDDIFNERQAAMEAELEKKILAKYGIDPETVQAGGQQKPAAKPMTSLGQRGGGSGNAESSAPQKLRLYESERDKMIDLGMDPKNPDAVAAYLRNHPRRK